eukprot:TRINITY_DN43516_c0_g1_i3.p3 TRINITY_DN43516_c0_g1~~TRINITY_DN43516_c0_g1_i3.p3  ORF type:complete len:105 (-),score=3.11 TRINITY_DN43516_c0_g1_i3:21-335(-)
MTNHMAKAQSTVRGTAVHLHKQRSRATACRLHSALLLFEVFQQAPSAAKLVLRRQDTRPLAQQRSSQLLLCIRKRLREGLFGVGQIATTVRDLGLQFQDPVSKL